ncbi:WYL domain-containing protein [Klebsiella aerogenes]|uniref:WYL domain-containing protein n=1 Tax=Klebsiella aerogenes TaxID=548 RepID=UPI001364A71C|nr:WYL domain-containing protein [Klebsiella aerogenes]
MLITIMCVGIDPILGAVAAVFSIIAAPLYWRSFRRRFDEAKYMGGYLISDKGAKLKTKSVRAKNNGVQPEKSSVETTATSYAGIELKDEASVEDGFQDFRDSLSIIWTDDQADELLTLQFTYLDFYRDKSKRLIDLSEASISNHNRLYLVGYCYEANEERMFKFSRISSNIECNGEKYSKNDFLRNILRIDPAKFH